MATILPQSLLPGPDALDHSRKLVAEIHRALEDAGGWISFARYMEFALYAPGLGYYSAGAAKLGAAGDFVTAPEMTSLFSRTLARAVLSRLQALHAPRATLLELGAGSGRMALDILTALGEAESLPERYCILEVSAELRSRQQQTLSALPKAARSRIEWCEALPETIEGVVLANEVLDAMPVHRVRRRDAEWVELGVALEKGEFAWSEHPIDNERLRAALAHCPPLKAPYDTEINLAAGDLMAALGHSLRSGSAIFIDYGFPEREFYHPQRSEGTLMCHIRHHAHGDPFVYPGLQDITAHVDFTAVARAARQAGLAVQDYQSQASWLLQEGIAEELARIPLSDPDRYYPAVSAVQKLLSAAEMGELFKVLEIGRGESSPLAESLLGL